MDRESDVWADPMEQPSSSFLLPADVLANIVAYFCDTAQDFLSIGSVSHDFCGQVGALLRKVANDSESSRHLELDSSLVTYFPFLSSLSLGQASQYCISDDKSTEQQMDSWKSKPFGPVVGLGRTQPHDHYYYCRRCYNCVLSSPLIESDQYQGGLGPAFLAYGVLNATVLNENGYETQYTTGVYLVCDVLCQCGTVLGKKYLQSRDPGNKYKENKILMEQVLVEIPECCQVSKNSTIFSKSRNPQSSNTRWSPANNLHHLECNDDDELRWMNTSLFKTNGACGASDSCLKHPEEWPTLTKPVQSTDDAFCSSCLSKLRKSVCNSLLGITANFSDRVTIYSLYLNLKEEHLIWRRFSNDDVAIRTSPLTSSGRTDHAHYSVSMDLDSRSLGSCHFNEPSGEASISLQISSNPFVSFSGRANTMTSYHSVQSPSVSIRRRISSLVNKIFSPSETSLGSMIGSPSSSQCSDAAKTESLNQYSEIFGYRLARILIAVRSWHQGVAAIDDFTARGLCRYALLKGVSKGYIMAGGEDLSGLVFALKNVDDRKVVIDAVLGITRNFSVECDFEEDVKKPLTIDSFNLDDDIDDSLLSPSFSAIGTASSTPSGQRSPFQAAVRFLQRVDPSMLKHVLHLKPLKPVSSSWLFCRGGHR